jgi:hypothetical protein
MKHKHFVSSFTEGYLPEIALFNGRKEAGLPWPSAEYFPDELGDLAHPCVA